MEASGLLSWGGASAIALVVAARYRPAPGTLRRTRKLAIDLDLVREQLIDVTTNGGARPMAMTTQTPIDPAAGLPPEQLYTWLEWVQDDLRRVEAQLQTLEAARSQLREQERLLGELLAASGAAASRR